MGKNRKTRPKGRGIEKTNAKTEKNLMLKHKKYLEKLGEADITEIVAHLEKEQKSLTTITTVPCSPPSARCHFTLVSHPHKDELILYGGEFFNGQCTVTYNDLFFYNIKKNEWKLISSPCGPAHRSAHQMVAVAQDGGQLWVFGGEYASANESQFHHYKDLWTMSLTTKKWQKINAPNGPSARSGHRMATAQKKLIIFGGFHNNNLTSVYFNDVHMFSLETYTWISIAVDSKLLPKPRSGSCIATYSNGNLLIWGGYTAVNTEKSNDRCITHSDAFVLMPTLKTGVTSQFHWEKVRIKGYTPMPCSGIGFAAGPNNKVYCFGGVMDNERDDGDIMGEFSKDFLELDMTAMKWNLLNVKKAMKVSTKSLAISSETASTSVTTTTMNGDFVMTVSNPSNGVALSESATNNIEHMEACGPSPRMNAGMCVHKGVLYMFGGIFEECRKHTTYNDFYALDIHKMDEWKVLIANSGSSCDWVDEMSSSSDDSDNDSDGGSATTTSEGSDSDSISEMDTD